MATQIFVNLPVKDLKQSMDFFSKIGYTFNMQFTDETATCMIISENIYAMLLTHDKFLQFTSRKIADTSKDTEVINALSVSNREEVDKIMMLALDAGATEKGEVQDMGFMYQRGFYDLDGHSWEYFYMDLSAFPQQ